MFYFSTVFIHPKFTHNFSCYVHFCISVPNDAQYLFMGPNKVGFFLVKVLSSICLLIDLHNSVPALTFTTTFLHSKHRKKTQM